MQLKREGILRKINIISEKDFLKKYGELYADVFLGNLNSHINFCKIEYIDEAYIGTIVIPKQKNEMSKKVCFGFYISKEAVTFFDDNNVVEKYLSNMKKEEESENDIIEGFLLNLLENIVRDDIIFLQKYHEKLTALEGLIIKKDLDKFEQELFVVRKNLLSLTSFYRQMFDICEKLQQITTKKDDEKNAHLFGILSEKIERMNSFVQMLNDYSIRLREMNQTKIAMRQNEIMKIFTVITAIFMPLTLITGWYGMNFQNMPELVSKIGYPLVGIVAVLIVVIEIVYFKCKKWF
ncbi:MAG: magnesium and cobalt transporter CorA [Lachnospiraceae bacterium]|nr:magnesium and cobalt transporter CorA [Lachnospiraceae bacterium]